MQPLEAQDYVFGPFYLDTHERCLKCDGKAVPITLKAFDTLFVLVQSSGHIVEKVEIMNKVWPDAFVEESNITQHIYKLRQILGVNADGRQYIETVPRRGYRFTAATSQSRRHLDLVTQHYEKNIAGFPDGEAIASLETTIISLAIVPFVLGGVESDSDYLKDRVTKRLTSILAELPQLRIMSRNIVFAVQK